MEFLGAIITWPSGRRLESLETTRCGSVSGVLRSSDVDNEEGSD